MKFLVAILALVLAVVVYQTNGLCNTCSINQIACVANNKFKFCIGGLPQEPAYNCLNGTYCSGNEQICGSNVPISCVRCNTCDSNNVFACTKNNAFTLCNESGQFNSSLEYICPEGLVCNVDSTSICVAVDGSGKGGTCAEDEVASTTPETVTSTTPNALTNSTEFCENKAMNGTFEVSADTTCQKYINCIFLNSAWRASLYICPTARYYNETLNRCVADKPARCV